MMNISEVQDQLKQMKIDGWLLYDFQGLNPIAKKLLGLQGRLLTRRWFYWIPQRGTPVILCHRIEQEGFQSLEGRSQIFKSWEEMHEGVADHATRTQDSGNGVLPSMLYPYVSRVDAGTLETGQGPRKRDRLISQPGSVFEARWSLDQFKCIRKPAGFLMQILFDSFRNVARLSRNGDQISEFSLQQTILEAYRGQGLFSFSPPIVAVNANSGNPHYEPRKENASPIRPGDFLLIDLWAKLERPNAVYADYTWVAYLGDRVPDRYMRVWEIVRKSREAAVNFVRERYAQKIDICGWQVDSVARDVITKEGYGESFVHRTGHSIGEEDHGNGANMDSLETKDERLLIPRTCFSIEPGIYLPEFGIRSEVNVFLGDEEVVVTGNPIQAEIFKISSD
jgi:Xaa-Pro aminopeptidase